MLMNLHEDVAVVLQTDLAEALGPLGEVTRRAPQPQAPWALGSHKKCLENRS